MRRYTVHPDGTIEPHVLTCGQVAEIVGADESTVRRWVRNGEAPDAGLPGHRIGIPSWWVTDRVTAGRRTSPEPSVVGGRDGATGSLSVIRRNTGGPTNRTARGAATPGVA